MDLAAQVRADGSARGGTSGGGAVLGRQRFDLPAGCGGADRRRRRGAGAARQLRAAGGAREDERHCAIECERLGVALEVRRPRRRRGGVRQRPGVGAGRSGTTPRASWRRRAMPMSRPGIPRPTRSRRSSTGWRRRRAGGRCWGCAPATASPAAGPAAARVHAREHARALRGARAALARRRRATPPTRTRAGGSAMSWCRRWSGSIPRRRPTCSRSPRSCATRRPCSTSWSTRCWPGGARSSWPRCARCAPALRRLVVQRLADAAAGGPAAGVARAGRGDRRAERARDRDARPARRRAGDRSRAGC